MVACPPPSLLCTLAILLRLSLAAAGGMSRRRLQQSSSPPPLSGHPRDDEDGAAAARVPQPPSAMLLPELVGRLLSEAAASVIVDDESEVIRLEDGVFWKPLREPDQVRAAGEHVSGGLPEVKGDLQTIDEAAAIAENDLPHRWLETGSPVLRARTPGLRGVTPDSVNLIPLDYDPGADVDMAQNLNHNSDSNGNSNNEDASRSSFPLNRRGDPGKDATLGTTGIRSRKDVAAASAKEGASAVTGPAQTESRETMTEFFVADASVQADIALGESQLPAAGQKSKTESAQVATMSREVQTFKKTKDKHSQTQPTKPTLYSMATQTDMQPAPWYLFRTSTQKKQLAAFISAFFVLIYLVLCYGLVCFARDRYADGNFFEELDFL